MASDIAGQLGLGLSQHYIWVLLMQWPLSLASITRSVKGKRLFALLGCTVTLLKGWQLWSCEWGKHVQLWLSVWWHFTARFSTWIVSLAPGIHQRTDTTRQGTCMDDVWRNIELSLC